MPKTRTNEESKRNRTSDIAAAVLFALVAAIFSLVYFTMRSQGIDGTKRIKVTVVDDAGKRTVYRVCTKARYLRQVFEEMEADEATGFSMEIDETRYGAIVQSVNALEADYQVNKAYWEFYVNGDYCSDGIDGQPVEHRGKYKVVYTIEQQQGT